MIASRVQSRGVYIREGTAHQTISLQLYYDKYWPLISDTTEYTYQYYTIEHFPGPCLSVAFIRLCSFAVLSLRLACSLLVRKVGNASPSAIEHLVVYS